MGHQQRAPLTLRHAERVAYLLPYNPGAGSGVWKKIEDQTVSWQASGREIRIFMLSRSTAPVATIAVDISTSGYSTRFSKIQALNKLVQELIEWQPDVVYHRYALAFPPVVRLARSLPVVLELNGNDLVEYRYQARFQHSYNRLTRARLMRGCSGFVLVTHELRTILPSSVPAEAVTTIGNAISLDRIAECPPPPPGAPLRGIFISSDPKAPWQALDKVLVLARAFPEWRFDLVGVADADVRQPPSNVRCHGPLPYDAYRPLLCMSDFAIGTLALHRNGMLEGSPLKVREYLAHGIPTIIGYRDPDFVGATPFILELDNREGNVADALSTIADFVTDLAGTRVPRGDIAHLDTAVKETQRLRFFDDVLARVRA